MLVAEDLRDRIIESMKNNIKSWTENDNESLTDDEIARSGKYRCEIDGSKKLMNLSKINSLKLIEDLGETVKDYIKNEIEFTYSCSGTWDIPSVTGTTTVPDPLVTTTKVQITKYTKKLKGYFVNFNDFCLKLAEVIDSAIIHIESEDTLLSVSDDEFGEIVITFSTSDSYENNMLNLAKGIIDGVKKAISTKTCSGTHTVPPAINSSMNCNMTKIE